MSDTGLKGGGEANMCNGMWHGKPVIAMDRMSAADYIVDGKTGYIISPGDVSTLRQRILDLWHDQQKCSSMGMEAKKHAEANFSHEAFVRRLLRLATLCKAHRNFTY
jgi:glycosyltransferase involved in cell wall biosynthesis